MSELTKDELDFLFHKVAKTSGKSRLHTFVKRFFQDLTFTKFFIIFLVFQSIRRIYY